MVSRKVSEEEIVAINEVAFFYPSDLVNTKTIIPLRVGEERWIYTSMLRVSVYIHHYSPPLQGIVVYYKSMGALMHDIDHDLAPQNLKNLFTSICSIYSYNTRAAAAGKFHVIQSQTKQQNQSFSRLGARLWNKIPEFKSKPQQLFKKHQSKLLQFLVHEGVYVDDYNLADKLFFISS